MQRVASFLAIAGALIVVRPHSLAGQGGDPAPVRVRWTLANALVYPDTDGGVRLWFATNTDAVLGGRRADRELEDGFDPDSVKEWAMLARQLLALQQPPASWEGDSLVPSDLLRGTDGTSLLAARVREGDRLGAGVRLYVVSKERKGLYFTLSPRELDAFLAALDSAVPRARLRVRQRESRTEEPTTPLAPDPSYVMLPRYPRDERNAYFEGEVWTEFVVDTAGRVDSRTIKVRLSDDASFEREVRLYLARTRYLPARVNGRPVRQQARQRFSFLLHR